jgi:hypothetical protein
VYVLRTLEAAGSPSDPIERMLIEQICLAHHNIGRLHVKAATADNPEEARVSLGAAALLTGEFRRCVLALKSYRVRDEGQGVAAREDRPPPTAAAEGKGVDGKLGTDRGGDELSDDTIALPEPEAGRGREEEPRQTARPHRRRA